jgi:hydrophobic/amphiphilic exporter-1 (mainly G- bacteria), HAE1 family
VLFVPTFFVVIQRFETWLKQRKKPKPNVVQTPQTGSSA